MSSYRFMHDRDIFRSDGAYPDKDPRDWVVIGWFTPDYRTLAEAFSVNLDRLDVPYHLFAKPIGEGWDTSRKPTVVLEAMNLYRGKTIILMDVDCIVEGDISEIAAFDRDVCFRVSARRRRHERITIQASSRVMAFRPTAGAHQFLESWATYCAGPETNDEVNLVYCHLHNGNVAHQQMPLKYAAWEVGNASAPPGTVIWHRSAHAEKEPLSWKQIGRLIEKPFRRGRTKALKAAASQLGPARG